MVHSEEINSYNTNERYYRKETPKCPHEHVGETV
jgi:glutamate synthase domain-containing protein 1